MNEDSETLAELLLHADFNAGLGDEEEKEAKVEDYQGIARRRGRPVKVPVRCLMTASRS